MKTTRDVHAVRLEGGAAVLASIEEISAALALDFCDVTGFGALDWVELVDPRQGPPIRIEGPLTLLDLRGRMRRAGGVTMKDLVCTLSRWRETGLEVLGGTLADGRANYLELSFVELVAVEARGSAAISSSQAMPAAGQKPSPPPPAKAQKQESGAVASRWAQALAESRKMEKEGRAANWDEVKVVLPARGDVVNHQHFGRCAVVKVDDEHISLKKPDGRVVQLGLAILEFEEAGGAPDGKTEFSVKIRRG